ncbi:Transposon Ty3-G Gag-Pol polyprotein [Trichinella papuae]|uniref:Transposon Ty3-G Gag-Pol polyprotein n=1 Tax=Trichinella papuae TaxID=268474 RepID=A0A0V1MQS9_9BILA|nr:Transposon Ty3-G Gag-Pol polyprotein [Trichinella papuae]
MVTTLWWNMKNIIDPTRYGRDSRRCFAIPRENFCLLNEQKSSHSRTCLSENACKILFHCYAYAYVALVSMVAGVRGAVVSVVSLLTWRKATRGEPLGTAEGSVLLGDGRRVRLCGQEVWSLQIGSWRGRIHVAVVESLVVPGILGTNFFDRYVKVIDWQSREMTVTDGSRIRIAHEPAQATRHSIGCARITASPREVPLEETVGEGPETDNGELEACERALVDRAECSARNRRVLRSILRRYRKAISYGEADLRGTNLVQHRIETGGAQLMKLPPRRLPQAQREVLDSLIREMLHAGVIEPTTGPWSSPVVLVRKKDGSPRFCVDYRRLNAVTRVDAPPIRYAGCAGRSQVVQHARLGVRLLAGRSRGKRPGEDGVFHTPGTLPIPLFSGSLGHPLYCASFGH